MNRLACVDIDAFPLQLLLNREPSWRSFPAVVVDKDQPQGIVLWANREARQFRVRPGLKYAQGLALCRKLRAGVVSTIELEQQLEQLTFQLQAHTPQVEACRETPGVFWLDATGLQRLYGTLERWASSVVADLSSQAFRATVAVGFRRHAVSALARAQGRLGRGAVLVLESLEEEDATLRRAPLEVLDIEPRLREMLWKLDLRTVGAFLSLPGGVIKGRLGKQAHRVRERWMGRLQEPLDPHSPYVPRMREVELDEPERDVNGLMFLLERELDALLEVLEAQGEAAAELFIELEFEQYQEGTHEALQQEVHASRSIERIRPAAPTVDASQLSNLIRLRLESLELPAGVSSLSLRVHGARVVREQMQLFSQMARRDSRAAERALARVRAELGDQAVVRARLRDAHLPEAGFCWEPVVRLEQAAPEVGAQPRLVRRILTRAEPLPSRSRSEPDGWLLRGVGHGHVVRCSGPYILSGGWWVSPVHREYHFAETRDGSMFWIYYDRPRRRWFLQGVVE